MSVTKHHLEDNCLMLYSIERDDMTTEAGLAGALDDLNTALDMVIADRAEDEADDFVSFDFFDKGEPFGEDAEPRDPDEEFDPTNGSILAFWAAVHRSPALRPRIGAWIDRLADELLPMEGGGYDDVWEDEEIQIGEPLVSLLALADRSFIPAYIKLLARWDMDHEVHQTDTIDKIFETHGICDETEALLYCRVVTNPGQHGGDQLDDLFPALQAHYGDFSKTPLFKRIVTGMHAEDTAWRADIIADGGRPADRDLLYTSHAPLRQAADTLIAELDAAAA